MLFSQSDLMQSFHLPRIRCLMTVPVARKPLLQPNQCLGLLVPQRRFISIPQSAHTISEAIEEELLTGDRLEYFHHTQPGQVLGGRFKIISKLGYGSSSTVWLAENLKL